MSLIEFAADVVATGTVLGADTTCTPEQSAAVLGAGFTENRGRNTLWRDWGLVEFYWQRSSGAESWRGTHFSVQLHRLGAEAFTPEPAIRERYGEFAGQLSLDALHTAVRGQGLELVEIPAGGPGVQEYWQPDTQTVVLVDTEHLKVIRLSSPLSAQAVAARSNRDRGRRLAQALENLVTAPEPERLRWLDRREPASTDRTNWWLHLLLLVDSRIERQPERRRDWILLYSWALQQACRRGALSAEETAIRMSYFVSQQHQREGADAAVLAVLPSRDQVVRDCLALIPITPGQATVQLECRPDNLDAMRNSRRAKNLITAAATHDDHLTAPKLAADLAHWISLRANLA